LLENTGTLYSFRVTEMDEIERTIEKLRAEVRRAAASGDRTRARDEERSFRAAPYSRPYYLCTALTADLLAPARGLLAVSTWPMERRVIGPLSPRVNYLEAAIRVVESLLRVSKPSQAAERLLRRFAANIPGAIDGAKLKDPHLVVAAAHAELEIHSAEEVGGNISRELRNAWCGSSVSRRL
jgi:hypothetical protein